MGKKRESLKEGSMKKTGLFLVLLVFALSVNHSFSQTIREERMEEIVRYKNGKIFGGDSCSSGGYKGGDDKGGSVLKSG